MRAILGVLIGIAASVATVMGLERVKTVFYPPLAGVDASTTDGMARLVASMPTEAGLIVVLSWFLGTLIGGYAANRVSGAVWPAWVVAGLGAAGGIATVATIPHPLFMQVGAVLAPALGGLVAARAAPGERRLSATRG